MPERSGPPVKREELVDETAEELPDREGTYDRLKREAVEEESAAQAPDQSTEGRNP